MRFTEQLIPRPNAFRQRPIQVLTFLEIGFSKEGVRLERQARLFPKSAKAGIIRIGEVVQAFRQYVLPEIVFPLLLIRHIAVARVE